MGGEKFDTPHPEGYLFGENMDLNFLGNRPVQVQEKQTIRASAEYRMSYDCVVLLFIYFLSNFFLALDKIILMK